MFIQKKKKSSKPSDMYAYFLLPHRMKYIRLDAYSVYSI